MFKKLAYIISFFLLLSSYLLSPIQTNAATVVKGIFVDVSYEEVVFDDQTTEKQLKKITLLNEKGNTITLNIDNNTQLFINSTAASIHTFQEGMFVEATVELRKVKELQGFADIVPGNSDAIGEYVTGTVNEIDRNGKYITINSANRQPKKFYIDNDTDVFKESKLVDLSVLFVGDSIKLKLSEYDTDLLSSIEVIVDGIQVEQVYKGTIQQLDIKQKKLVVKGEKVLHNWTWQLATSTEKDITSRTFTAKTPIYLGNKKIDPSQLPSYVNNDVYYVTIRQFGKEVIQKIIIKQTNERTIHENMSSVDTSTKKIRLATTGNIPYHNGTIIIRNGRLVDASALSQSGDAYVITNGVTSNQYATIIHISNDGFQSSNLSNHEVYFGQISTSSSYKVSLTNTSKLINNYWSTTPSTTFSFSNDTVVKEDNNYLTKDFTNSTGKYAYFYMKDNHVVTAHIIGTGTPAQLISVGRYNYSFNNSIQLKDASQWNNGSWIKNTTSFYSLDVGQTTFIREGKVITQNDLNENDRLFIIHDSFSTARIILVD